MKKTVQLLLVAAMFFSLSTFAYSAPGLYVGGNFGLASLNESDISSSDIPAGVNMKFITDKGLSLGGFVGYAFENNFRIEGELVSQSNDFDKIKVDYLGTKVALDLDGDISSGALLANGYYDFKNESRFTPFIGAGVGIANVVINDLEIVGSGESDEDGDETVIAYQLTVGVGYEITERITLDLKYRYFATEDLDIDGGTVEYSSNNFYSGIRFSF